MLMNPSLTRLLFNIAITFTYRQSLPNVFSDRMVPSITVNVPEKSEVANFQIWNNECYYMHQMPSKCYTG